MPWHELTAQSYVFTALNCLLCPRFTKTEQTWRIHLACVLPTSVKTAAAILSCDKNEWNWKLYLNLFAKLEAKPFPAFPPNANKQLEIRIKCDRSALWNCNSHGRCDLPWFWIRAFRAATPHQAYAWSQDTKLVPIATRPSSEFEAFFRRLLCMRHR